MSNHVYTKEAPEAIGPYSQAVVAGKLVFTSGQMPIVPETGELAEGDISAQAEQAIKNVGAILKAAGAGYGNVVKATCYLRDMADFAAFNAVYARYFTEKPARACVEVSGLAKGALVEVDAIAVLE